MAPALSGRTGRTTTERYHPPGIDELGECNDPTGTSIHFHGGEAARGGRLFLHPPEDQHVLLR